MIELPEVVVLRGHGHTHLRRVRRGKVVQFETSVQREAVLHLQRQPGRARIGAGADDGINLTITIEVGAIEFLLKDEVVEQDVGVKARQGAQNVFRARPAVARDADLRQLALGHLYFHHSVGERLTRQCHVHGDESASPVRELQFGERLPDFLEAHLAGVLAKNPVQYPERERGVAGDLVAPDFKSGTVGAGARGGTAGRGG